jgi:glycosyltransferase involved in cell wall biosynthesis
VFYEQMRLPFLARAQEIEVLLSTCNVRPIAWRGPSVVVLQSLQYLHFPSEFGCVRKNYLKATVAYSLHTADAIITVSDWERTEAIRLFDLQPERVVTVYHGLSDAVRRSAIDGGAARPMELVGNAPYLLMVSTLYGFKNHARLIRAFAAVVARTAIPHCLALAGGDADVTADDLRTLAKELQIEDRLLLLGAVPHEQVAALLHHADAVAYPSLYETFGHPILEALAYGRPLVTSNRGATAEIAGNAARLVDATNVDSIADGLMDVLTNDSLRRFLADAGPTRAATFTWELCARKTVDVLTSAIETHRVRRMRRPSFK